MLIDEKQSQNCHREFTIPLKLTCDAWFWVILLLGASHHWVENWNSILSTWVCQYYISVLLRFLGNKLVFIFLLSVLVYICLIFIAFFFLLYCLQIISVNVLHVETWKQTIHYKKRKTRTWCDDLKVVKDASDFNSNGRLLKVVEINDSRCFFKYVNCICPWSRTYVQPHQ